MRTAAALALLLILAACGSTRETAVTLRTAPKDREAADLYAAYRMGLLSAGEYAAQRARLGI